MYNGKKFTFQNEAQFKGKKATQVADACFKS